QVFLALQPNDSHTDHGLGGGPDFCPQDSRDEKTGARAVCYTDPLLSTNVDHLEAKRILKSPLSNPLRVRSGDSEFHSSQFFDGLGEVDRLILSLPFWWAFAFGSRPASYQRIINSASRNGKLKVKTENRHDTKSPNVFFRQGYFAILP